MDKKSIEKFKTIAIIVLVLYIILGTNPSSKSNESHKSEQSNERAEESAYWFNMGYEQGYSEAEYAAQAEYDRGYSDAQFEMKGELEKAERYGSENAYEVGYENGYSDGYSDCEEENGLAEPIGGSGVILKPRD